MTTASIQARKPKAKALTEPQALFALRRIGNVLSRYAYHFRDERRLHDGIAQALTDAGVAFEHEVQRGPHRFDFLCANGVVIEVKIKGSQSEALRQVDRYLSLEEVRGVLIAGTTAWVRSSSCAALRAKPVLMTPLARSSF